MHAKRCCKQKTSPRVCTPVPPSPSPPFETVASLHSSFMYNSVAVLECLAATPAYMCASNPGYYRTTVVISTLQISSMFA